MPVLRWMLVAAGILVSSSIAQAEERAAKPPAPAKAPPDRVHVGATSVTVVDEHETVDDVITRLRAAKAKTATAPKTTSQPAPPTPPASGQGQDGRETLRRERETAAAHADVERAKDDRRERSTGAHARTDKKQRR